MEVCHTSHNLAILLILLSGLASVVAVTWKNEFGCVGSILDMSCASSPDKPYIYIESGAHGVYHDTDCYPGCGCDPDTQNDCLVDMLDIYPQDLERIKEACDNQTSCIIVVGGGDITEYCGTQTQYWRIVYQCMDESGPLTTVAPPEVTSVVTTDSSSPSTVPDTTTPDDGGGGGGGGGSSVGAIVGGVLGTLVLVAVIVVIVIYILKCRDGTSTSKSSQPQTHISQLPPATDTTHSSLNPIPAEDEGGFAYDNKAYEDTLKLSDMKKEGGASNGAVKNGSATYENVSEMSKRPPRKLVPSVCYNPAGGGSAAKGQQPGSQRNSLAVPGSRNSLAYPVEIPSTRSSLAYPEPSSKRSSVAFPEATSQRSSVAYPEATSQRSSVAYPEATSQRSSVAYPEATSQRSSVAFPEATSQRSSVAYPEATSQRSSVAYPESSSKSSSVALSVVPQEENTENKTDSSASKSKQDKPIPSDTNNSDTSVSPKTKPDTSKDKTSKAKKKSKTYENLNASRSNLSTKSDLGRSYESLVSQAKSQVSLADSTAGHYEDVQTKTIDKDKEGNSEKSRDSTSEA